MATEITEFPVEYLQSIDEVLTQGSFSSKYDVAGAEFVDKKTVKVPVIEFANGLKPYDKFKTDTGVKLSYETYTLDHDVEASFEVDAVEDIDSAHLLTVNTVSEFQRVKVAPEMDLDFFKAMAKYAGGKSSGAVEAANIKGTLREIRSAFTQAGLVGGDLYMSSEAVEALENAIDRQFAGEGTITEIVGNYNGFNIYEVPDDRLNGVPITAIANGCARYIKKRAASYFFAPGTHTGGDCYLMQMRWVYGAVAHKNKRKGIFVHTAE